MTGKGSSAAPLVMGPRRVIAVPVAYVLLMLVLLYTHWSGPDITTLPIIFLELVLVLYLARELSIRYTLDERGVHAFRIFGWRTVALGGLHKVEYTSLRDISPVGLFGSWGWRSRLWSPSVGHFDNISTFHRGLLVYGEGVPLFISPKDPEAFASALAERAGLPPATPTEIKARSRGMRSD